jgi:hypothetical protein
MDGFEGYIATILIVVGCLAVWGLIKYSVKRFEEWRDEDEGFGYPYDEDDEYGC